MSVLNEKSVFVDEQTMSEIYEELKTPYKYGGVLKFEKELCDSPTVFRYKDAWYMSFIKIDKDTQQSGYESHLARSTDLVHWEYLFPTLRRSNDDAWDSKQVAAYAAFVENDLYGQYRIQEVNGYYHFAYLGGSLDGYETDPLCMGQCKTIDIVNPEKYEKSPKPVLSPMDDDARAGENLTLFKAYMFKDEKQVLGYPYVNVYNARGPEHRETIFMAVSNDGENWQRYGEKAIIFDDSPEQNIAINGDPQILVWNDIYIMLYFVVHGNKVFNTFACSYDLVHWTKWQGKALIESELEWENVHAHKPWMVVDNGIVYHFYCAVNDKGERFIAVASSKPIQ